MPESFLTLNGKRFVVLPEKEYRSLQAKATSAAKPKRSSTNRVTNAQDSGEIAQARRALADPKRVTAAEVFRKLGV